MRNGKGSRGGFLNTHLTHIIQYCQLLAHDNLWLTAPYLIQCFIESEIKAFAQSIFTANNVLNPVGLRDEWACNLGEIRN